MPRCQLKWVEDESFAGESTMESIMLQSQVPTMRRMDWRLPSICPMIFCWMAQAASLSTMQRTMQMTCNLYTQHFSCRWLCDAVTLPEMLPSCTAPPEAIGTAARNDKATEKVYWRSWNLMLVLL